MSDKASTLKSLNVNIKFNWYVVHTHSGLENKAKENLTKRAKQHGLLSYFREILIPMESISIFKAGKKKKNFENAFQAT